MAARSCLWRSFFCFLFLSSSFCSSASDTCFHKERPTWMLSLPRWGPKPMRWKEEAWSWLSSTLSDSRPRGGQSERNDISKTRKTLQAFMSPFCTKNLSSFPSESAKTWLGCNKRSPHFLWKYFFNHVGEFTGSLEALLQTNCRV